MNNRNEIKRLHDLKEKLLAKRMVHDPNPVFDKRLECYKFNMLVIDNSIRANAGVTLDDAIILRDQVADDYEQLLNSGYLKNGNKKCIQQKT